MQEVKPHRMCRLLRYLQGRSMRLMLFTTGLIIALWGLCRYMADSLSSHVLTMATVAVVVAKGW